MEQDAIHKLMQTDLVAAGIEPDKYLGQDGPGVKGRLKPHSVTAWCQECTAHTNQIYSDGGEYSDGEYTCHRCGNISRVFIGWVSQSTEQ